MMVGLINLTLLVIDFYLYFYWHTEVEYFFSQMYVFILTILWLSLLFLYNLILSSANKRTKKILWNSFSRTGSAIEIIFLPEFGKYFWNEYFETRRCSMTRSCTSREKTLILNMQRVMKIILIILKWTFSPWLKFF